MPGKIAILKENGETLNSNIVSVFTMPETEKKYIITTENTVDPHGLTVLHVSELVDDTLARVGTTEEWDAIKNVMRVIISGNAGPYTYLPAIANARTNGQYSRDISVSDAATKQLTDAYFASQSSQGGAQPVPAGVQAQNPADVSNVPVGAVPPVQNPGGVDNTVAQNTVNPMGQPVPGVTPQAPVAMQTSSIFPENSGVSADDNEVIPGIAEIGSDQNINSMSKPVLTPAESALPINPSPSAQMTGTVEPVMPISVTPVMDNIVVPQQPQQVGDIVPTVQPTVDVANPVAPVVQQPVPQTLVPNATQAPVVQLTAGVPEPPSVAVNFNVAPSFAPNATLDEVVSGSQEVFMQSVNNLVQTMTEKIYRELYEKEAALKEREAVVTEREKMVNAQMMTMMNNFNNVAPTVVTPMAPVAQVPVQDMSAMAQPMQQPMAMNMNPMQGVVPQQSPQPMMPMQPMVNNAVISHITQDNQS